MSAALSILKRIFSIFSAVFVLIAGAVDAPSQTRRYAEVSAEYMVLQSAYLRSQDVTTDGKFWYFSCKSGLEKVDIETGKTVLVDLDAIPSELKELGVDHIGGISFAGGKIYAALEDSKVWNNVTICVFNPDTFKAEKYATMSLELQIKGAPWLCADEANGMIYSTQRDNAPCLIAYSLDTLEFVKTIELSEPVHKIQGGDMHGNELFVATNNDTQAVYRIDVLTGKTEKCFDRNLATGSEGEGLAVLETPDGALLHVLDMGPLFVNANFRHYSCEIAE
ncbi:MAG: hypothetical protein GX051_03105 [Clostridiales bacterium]|nr:hypothetical protein [Clostridiales bacterium]